jgi:hypothetical protein
LQAAIASTAARTDRRTRRIHEREPWVPARRKWGDRPPCRETPQTVRHRPHHHAPPAGRSLQPAGVKKDADGTNTA